ncbi:N-acetylmuramoyl-L-alanine amidase [Bhargavaea beijingensis]|uniref:N-acetylmuramoyl-L-alanine amidase n=1 Tax=Bhargavaea beijingensis TaxID=426756 RepID=A0A1G7A385_9BACL|nr:N-acetylmuramoyl-L-alanine amidase [Bhargavaea beijingensis]SDE08515.1 N-acetylmuramoyl-L-alanine amidase [Bhargavaea beijingensis]
MKKKVALIVSVLMLAMSFRMPGIHAENLTEPDPGQHLLYAYITSAKAGDNFVPYYSDADSQEEIGELKAGEKVAVLEIGDRRSNVQVLQEDGAINKQQLSEPVRVFVANEFLEMIEEENLPETEEAAPEDPPVNPDSATDGMEDAEVPGGDLAETKEKPEPVEEQAAPETTEVQAKSDPVDENQKESGETANPEPATSMMSVQNEATASHPALYGLALKSPTRVYDRQNPSAVLKSYGQGTILKFTQADGEWYAATVYIAGQAKDGLIAKKDVDLLVGDSSGSGYAAKQTVHVYSGPDTGSAVLKSYPLNQRLAYRTLSENWHSATVYVSGEKKKGYIRKADVSGEKVEGLPLKGIALKSPTHVFSSQDLDSKKLKSYGEGKILSYRSTSGDWYGATVYVNGKAMSGFIHKSHVANITERPTPLRGVAKKQPTPVYSSASLSAPSLKTYSAGTVLKYETFAGDWYKATVYVSGKARTGYIHRSHVIHAANPQIRIQGAAAKSKVPVYSRASRNSTSLKSYSFGHKLTYYSFIPGWYEATVYVNGKARKGYIHESDVLSLQGKKVVLDAGHGGHDPGGVALGLVEKEIVLDTALRAERLLKNAGAHVIMTRKTDIFLELSERAAIANSSGADLFISIHANKFNGDAKGVETFWYGKYEKQRSIHLANALQDQLVARMGMSYRRVAEGNFHVIRETKIPSSLIEIGFIDHPQDSAKLAQAIYRERAAEAILLGIGDYF